MKPIAAKNPRLGLKLLYAYIAFLALIGILNLFAMRANAESYHLTAPTGGVDKFQAMSKALNNPDAIIYKCVAQKITKKMTLKNIPATPTNDFVKAPTQEQREAVKAAGTK